MIKKETVQATASWLIFLISYLVRVIGESENCLCSVSTWVTSQHHSNAVQPGPGPGRYPTSSVNEVLCLFRTSTLLMSRRSVRNMCSCCALTGYSNTSKELAWDCRQSQMSRLIVSSKQKFSAWYMTIQRAIHSMISYSLQSSLSRRGRSCIRKCSEIRSQRIGVTFAQFSIVHFHFHGGGEFDTFNFLLTFAL